jgi:hypothetical protein
VSPDGEASLPPVIQLKKSPRPVSGRGPHCPTHLVRDAVVSITHTLFMFITQLWRSQWVIDKASCYLETRAEYGHSAMRHDRVASRP